MEIAFVVNVGRTRGKGIFSDQPHLSGVVFRRRLDQCPVAHYRLTTRLAIDSPARTVIMRLAFSGTVVDMCENAEPEFRILIEDLPLQNVVPEMSSDECCVLQDVLDERADFLAALDTRIVHQDAMTCIRELLKSVAHHP